MESISSLSYDPKEFNTENTAEMDELTPISVANSTINLNSDNIATSQFDLKDNININNEKDNINEKRKLNIFNFIEEEDEDKYQEDNPNKINIIDKENNNIKGINSINIINENDNILKKDSLSKTKSLRMSGLKKKPNLPTQSINTQRKTLFPKSLLNSFKNKNINNNLRKTLMAGNDFNRMRISITNFNKVNNNINQINHIKNNIKNFVKYENMFLDDEVYLRAPGSFPDEEEKNYLLRLNFLDENNYLEEDNVNNEYIDKTFIRQTNSISYNSKLEKNVSCKFLMNSLNFDKIEEEDDKEEKEENKTDNNAISRITKVGNAIKNLFNDEDELPGKNIEYAENVKTTNNFEEGTFNKNLVSSENESKISFMSINLFIKKIALYNFRINYPLLYKAFLQQYTIFLSPILFIEKIMQAFELYYNKKDKITNELIDLLNKVISENYERVKADFILLEKVKNFYSYLKVFIFTEGKSALEKDIDNIYYILTETDEEEELNYARRFVLERRKSNSIFIKSKAIYSNIFNEIEKAKTIKKKKLFSKSKTTLNINYKYFYIFGHNVMEIAQYLTCISYQMMRNISQKELLNKNFVSKDKNTKAPNVMKMIDRFNKLVLFIIEDIFSYDNKKTRCQCIEKWIEVALKLQELHNYNDLVMINTCFVNLTLNKLKLTFKKLSTKYKTIIKEMNNFCSSKNCYINIRRLIFNNKGIPYIPYLGIILKEIVNIEEMKYIIDENNINFDKVVKLYNVINRFNEFKKSKFAFEKSKELDILVNLNPKTEDELDQMVGQIEPKLKIFAIKGNKKRITNTDKFYYDKKTNEKNEAKEK